MVGYNVFLKRQERRTSNNAHGRAVVQDDRTASAPYDSVWDKEGGRDSQAPPGLRFPPIMGGNHVEMMPEVDSHPYSSSLSSSSSSQAPGFRGGLNAEAFLGSSYMAPTGQDEDRLSIFPALPMDAMDAPAARSESISYDAHEQDDVPARATETDVYAPVEGVVSFVSLVTLDGGGDVVEEVTDLRYLHCGPTYTLGANNHKDHHNDYRDDESKGGDDDTTTKIIHEIILLHGAKFTKEDWRSSSILQHLCDPTAPVLSKGDDSDEGDEENYGAFSGSFSSSSSSLKAATVAQHQFSVVALDLPVTVDGLQLAHAFESLASEGVLSGMPATFVTPSASGKGMLDLAALSRHATEELAKERENHSSSSSSSISVNLLQSVVQAWVPFACPAVQTAEGATLNEFSDGKIPVLTLYGHKDAMGKVVADKLEALAGAKAMVLGENHAGYLDDPDKFVRTLKRFLIHLETWFVQE